MGTTLTTRCVTAARLEACGQNIELLLEESPSSVERAVSADVEVAVVYDGHKEVDKETLYRELTANVGGRKPKKIAGERAIPNGKLNVGVVDPVYILRHNVTYKIEELVESQEGDNLGQKVPKAEELIYKQVTSEVRPKQPYQMSTALLHEDEGYHIFTAVDPVTAQRELWILPLSFDSTEGKYHAARDAIMLETSLDDFVPTEKQKSFFEQLREEMNQTANELYEDIEDKGNRLFADGKRKIDVQMKKFKETKKEVEKRVKGVEKRVGKAEREVGKMRDDLDTSVEEIRDDVGKTLNKMAETLDEELKAYAYQTNERLDNQEEAFTSLAADIENFGTKLDDAVETLRRDHENYISESKTRMDYLEGALKTSEGEQERAIEMLKDEIAKKYVGKKDLKAELSDIEELLKDKVDLSYLKEIESEIDDIQVRLEDTKKYEKEINKINIGIDSVGRALESTAGDLTKGQGKLAAEISKVKENVTGVKSEIKESQTYLEKQKTSLEKMVDGAKAEIYTNFQNMLNKHEAFRIVQSDLKPRLNAVENKLAGMKDQYVPRAEFEKLRRVAEEFAKPAKPKPAAPKKATDKGKGSTKIDKVQ